MKQMAAIFRQFKECLLNKANVVVLPYRNMRVTTDRENRYYPDLHMIMERI